MVQSNKPSDEQRFVLPGYHVADCVKFVTGPLPPDFKDWPSHMQDQMYEAVDDLCEITGKPYVLFQVESGHDGEFYYARAMAIAPKVIGQAMPAPLVRSIVQ